MAPGPWQINPTAGQDEQHTAELFTVATATENPIFTLSWFELERKRKVC